MEESQRVREGDRRQGKERGRVFWHPLGTVVESGPVLLCSNRSRMCWRSRKVLEPRCSLSCRLVQGWQRASSVSLHGTLSWGAGVSSLEQTGATCREMAGLLHGRDLRTIFQISMEDMVCNGRIVQNAREDRQRREADGTSQTPTEVTQGELLQEQRQPTIRCASRGKLHQKNGCIRDGICGRSQSRRWTVTQGCPVRRCA